MIRTGAGIIVIADRGVIGVDTGAGTDIAGIIGAKISVVTDRVIGTGAAIRAATTVHSRGVNIYV